MAGLIYIDRLLKLRPHVVRPRPSLSPYIYIYNDNSNDNNDSNNNSSSNSNANDDNDNIKLRPHVVRPRHRTATDSRNKISRNKISVENGCQSHPAPGKIQCGFT